MLKRGTDVSCCKAFSSDASPSNSLARAASYAASALASRGFINSYPRAFLAAGFFGLTNYVIFEDVLRHGAAITTDHLLSFAVLVGTFAAGHYFWPTLRHREYGTAAGLALLFVAGTVYCVLTSAGRNAEALTAKAAKVTADDGPRLALARQVEDALTAKTKAEKAYEDAKDATTEAAEKRDAECATGPGAKCRGAVLVADAAAGREAKAKTEAEGASSTYYMRDARLRGMTKRETNVDLRYASKVLGYMGVTVTDEQLADIVPFIKRVFCEFATLLFAAGAFRHRPAITGTISPTAATVPQPDVPQRNRPVLVVSHGATVPHAKDAALVLLRQRLAVHGTVPQDDLRELFGVKSKSTVSRWCDEWETLGVIARTVAGRSKTVSLAQPKRTGWLATTKRRA